MTTTLYSPCIVSHQFSTHVKSLFQIHVGHIDSYSRKLMWVIILFYASILCKVLIRSRFQKDLGEDQDPWAHIISTLTRQL